VTQQKANHTFDYRPKLAELDDIVFDIYKIEPDERKEVSDWYIRHYPKLFDATAPEA
jgi:hypothetical protein